MYGNAAIVYLGEAILEIICVHSFIDFIASAEHELDKLVIYKCTISETYV